MCKIHELPLFCIKTSNSKSWLRPKVTRFTHQHLFYRAVLSQTHHTVAQLSKPGVLLNVFQILKGQNHTYCAAYVKKWAVFCVFLRIHNLGLQLILRQIKLISGVCVFIVTKSLEFISQTHGNPNAWKNIYHILSLWLLFCSQKRWEVVQLPGGAEQAHAPSEGLCTVLWHPQRRRYGLHQEDVLPASGQPHRRSGARHRQWVLSFLTGGYVEKLKPAQSCTDTVFLWT